MRPLPAPSEYGTWDVLPEDPPENVLDLTDPEVKDAMRRRDILKQQWRAYFDYPKGHWSEEAAEDTVSQGEAWRNWFLRRSWEGISLINGFLRRQTETT